MERKDLTTSFGLLSGALVILISLIWGQKNIGKTLLLFLDVPSIFIVIFGSLSAIIISFHFETTKNIPRILRNAFHNKQQPKIDMIKMFVNFSQIARRNGLLSLEDEVESIDNEYMKLGLQMVIDGVDEDTTNHTFELAIEQINGRHKKNIQVFRMWANLAPSFGMLGTFIGLILMMANMSDMSKFGSAFSTVLVTSFYGAILSNLVFAPLANKLDINNSEELEVMNIIVEGVNSIRIGVNPKVIEQNLKLYLSDKEKKEYELSTGVAGKNQSEEAIHNAA